MLSSVIVICFGFIFLGSSTYVYTEDHSPQTNRVKRIQRHHLFRRDRLRPVIRHAHRCKLSPGTKDTSRAEMETTNGFGMGY